MIGLIWAQSTNGWIGKNGTMPWHVPEDLAHFKHITGSDPVVMGRTTWDSLNPRFKPLPGRHNIVLTRNTEWSAEGAITAHSPLEALETAEGLTHDGDFWVTGGSHVYHEFMPIAHRCEITELDLIVSGGDAAAPRLDSEIWQEIAATQWELSSSGIRYRFLTYDRVSLSK